MDPIMDVVSIFTLIKVCCFGLFMAQLTKPCSQESIKRDHCLISPLFTPIRKQNCDLYQFDESERESF